MFKFVHDYKVTPYFSDHELVYKTVLHLGYYGNSRTIIHFPMLWF